VRQRAYDPPIVADEEVAQAPLADLQLAQQFDDLRARTDMSSAEVGSSSRS
jgi:hypothetical protein